MLEVRVSESGSAKMMRSYFSFVCRRKTRPSSFTNSHARIRIGAVGMQLRAQLLDDRINLDRGDSLHAIRERGRGIGAGAGAENERMLERDAGKKFVDAAVEWLLFAATGSCFGGRCC